MNYCQQDGCAGHLGKFPTCLAEALYQEGLNGWADETTGSVEYEGHFSLFILPNDEVTRLDERLLVIPPGNYILCEDEGGFVSLVTYHTEEEARESFATSYERYIVWLDQEEG